MKREIENNQFKSAFGDMLLKNKRLAHLRVMALNFCISTHFEK